ncbi:MAG: hypothetical protein U1E10_04475 [Bdellovibrionales bacterium]|nr:hypothetical protein [Bdellovibrionales bacterium]
MWKSRVLKHTVHVANGKNFKKTQEVPKNATRPAYNADEAAVKAWRKSNLPISVQKYDTR